MRIRRAGPSADQARIDDYLGTGDRLSEHTDGRERWQHHEVRTEGRYVVVRYSLIGEVPRWIDRTVFELGEERFVEAERYEEQGGPNLYSRPIVLPAVLDQGVSHHPLGNRARVALLHAGPTQVALDGRVEVIDAIALLGEEAGRREVQWLARGVGVIALGPLGEPPRQWRTGSFLALASSAR